MYVELWGHLFGLASAVLTYNRDPELHVALMRTMLYTPCTHFYDDRLTVGMGFAAGSGQRSYSDLCSLTGKVLGADKHEQMAASVILLGACSFWEACFRLIACVGTEAGSARESCCCHR